MSELDERCQLKYTDYSKQTDMVKYGRNWTFFPQIINYKGKGKYVCVCVCVCMQSCSAEERCICYIHTIIAATNYFIH